MTTSCLTIPAYIRFLVAGLLAASVLGCTPPGPRIDPAVLASYRERFLSTDDLADAVTVADIRATLEKAGDSTSSTPVVLVGQVGGVPNPLEETQPDFPWRAGEASFYLVDQEVASKLAAHLAAQGPDHQDCPFCARAIAKSVDSMAAVNFNGKDGKPIRIGAKELFELQEGDIVVVEGDASRLGGKMLVVEARKIHAKR